LKIQGLQNDKESLKLMIGQVKDGILIYKKKESSKKAEANEKYKMNSPTVDLLYHNQNLINLVELASN